MFKNSLFWLLRNDKCYPLERSFILAAGMQSNQMQDDTDSALHGIVTLF